MDISWVKREINVSEIEEIEKKHLCEVKSDENINIVNGKLPFGTNYFIWREMKQLFLSRPDEDIIWEFDNGEFLNLSGRRGYVLTRKSVMKDRDIITGWAIITEMN
jgi:hypothetical protein